MELQEAIEFLKDYADWARQLNVTHPDTMGIAIDTVLAELDRLNKRIEYALDFAVDYDGYYNTETKQGDAEGLAMTIDDMVDVLKGNLKGVE